MAALYDLRMVENTPHHPAMNELVDILCHRTNNVHRDFFQAEVAYFLSLIPSTMRTTVNSPERGKIPVNVYSIALAQSGFGKGHSVNLLEDVIADFRDSFQQQLFAHIAEKNLFDLAVSIAASKGGDEAKELEILTNDFRRQGQAPFLFDSGTGPAVKQLRYKYLLGGAGSINFQMDEIGHNLVAQAEITNMFLELYDLGRIKNKLVKNTEENLRGLDIQGSTPANMLMFGTTSKLFDGSRTEEEFYSLLEAGYARRCFFGIGKFETTPASVNPEDVYNSLVNKNRSQALTMWRKRLHAFADMKHYNKMLDVPKPVGVELVSYRLFCEATANDLPDHDVIRKAELSHRYFKALKLAGVYAFLDGRMDISMDNLRQAIKVAEESGLSFQDILKRERNFVRLAKYVANTPGKLTHADLVEDLPFYPGSATPRKEIMDLAVAWGVGNNVIIKREVVSGVEFFEGSMLQETDLNKLQFSVSDHFANDYEPMAKAFDKLPKLLTAPDMHWCNHYFNNEHRNEENALSGFNLLVVDVDGHERDKAGNVTRRGIKLEAVHELLKDYTFITSTTKRHTEDEHRFRLIMPTNYELILDKEEYREFMNSFLSWLPFNSDESANQRSKKWMTFDQSQVHVHKGIHLVDVLPFIPKTRLNMDYQARVVDLSRLDNLERWFLNNMDLGQRNVTLHNFAMMLFDAGMTYDKIVVRVHALNEKSAAPLKKDEIETTILKSVGQKFAKKGN